MEEQQTTPDLFNSITKKEGFFIKGRSFTFQDAFPGSGNTKVCKCKDNGNDLDYVVKVIKLGEIAEEIQGSKITTSFAGDHQVGDFKFSEKIDKLLTSFVVTYEIAELINDEIVLVSAYRGIDLKTYGNNKKGKLLLCEALQILVALVNALVVLQKENIIHRDIKPSNVFLTYRTHETMNHMIDILDVALGDFGIAIHLNQTNSLSNNLNENEPSASLKNLIDDHTQISSLYPSETKTMAGTKGYRAPESENGIFTLSSDIFSLGRTIIWLLFNRQDEHSLDEIDKSIQESDLNYNDNILDFIIKGNLEEDIEVWGKFISIIQLMTKPLNERTNLEEILRRIFRNNEKTDRPVLLEKEVTHFNNRSLRISYAINGWRSLLDSTLMNDREIVLEAVKQNGHALEYADESLKRDREIVLEAVKQNGYALEYADESLKKDREIVLEAVKQHVDALRYADKSLKKDRLFVLEAVKQDGFALEYADESLKKDREIVLEAVKQDGHALRYADESLKKDRLFVLEAASTYVLAYADELLTKDNNTIQPLKTTSATRSYGYIYTKKDRETILESVKQDGNALEYADESLKKDREIVLEAVKQDGYALKFVEESLKRDREIVLEAVKQNRYALEYADESLKKDREIVLQVVKQNRDAIKYADESLKKDRLFVLAAVKQNRDAIKYADKSLKTDRLFVLEAVKQDDREIVLEAVKQNGYAFTYADELLKKDRLFVLEIVNQDGLALRHIDESLKKDREIVLGAVKQNGHAFAYVDELLKRDREIVLEAVKQNGYALRHIDESLKKDREIVLEAVKQNGYAIEYADKSLKKDREIVLEAVKQHVDALRYADESLKKDRLFVLEAVKQDGNALEYADKSLKKDREIVLEAVKQNGYAFTYVDELLQDDI